MLISGKLRLGIVGLAIGLSGAIAWDVHHRANLPASSIPSAAQAVPVSPSTRTHSDGPQITSASEDAFPNLNGSATDDELLALARKAVARSPQHAIEWAQSQSDSAVRRRLLSAVLRAWGERDPGSAVDWALMQDDGERQNDMDAALAGAVTQPHVALAIVRRLLADDPGDGTAFGAAFIVALSNAGQFSTALEFLKDAPPDARDGWMTATFHRWGESRPQAALQALDSLADGQQRNSALQAIMGGWAANDPAGLAAYAVSMPAGPGRDSGLKLAMDNWSLQDPAGMAAWLNTLPPGAEFDQGVALMLAKTDTANLSTEAALQWVESVSDPVLKFNSLLPVLNQWAQSDLAAAAGYVKNAAWLDDQQRSTLLQKIGAVQ